MRPLSRLAALLFFAAAGCQAAPLSEPQTVTKLTPPRASAPAGEASTQPLATEPSPSAPMEGTAATDRPLFPPELLLTPSPGASGSATTPVSSATASTGPLGLCPSPVPGLVTTMAGGADPGKADGPGAAARFARPSGIAALMRSDRLELYVADYANNAIRLVIPNGGCDATVTTLAGGKGGRADGTGAQAQFADPRGMAIDRTAAPPVLYLADYGNHCIRRAELTSDAPPVFTTIAGDGLEGFADGRGGQARFAHPTAVAVDGSGDVYVADSYNHRIRRLTRDGAGAWSVSTVMGSGAGGPLSFPGGVAVAASAPTPDPSASPGATLLPTIYVADTQHNRIVSLVSDGAGARTTRLIAGSGQKTRADGRGEGASFAFPGDLVLTGSRLIVCDTQSQSLREVTIATGEVNTLAGDTAGGHLDGIGLTARFNYPLGIAALGNNVYVADTDNHRVRRLVRAIP